VIQAQSLPPGKSVLDYPVVMPGQEMTPEQQEQATTARLAGIVMSVAAAKAVLADTTTNQIVALLRTSDLTTEAAIKAFAKTAASIVRMAIKQARNITWSGVRMRAAEVGVSFPATPPTDREMPKELRYSRGSTLEDAYARIGYEYQENLLRTKDDKQIKQLVVELENQFMSPSKRFDDLTSDATEGVLNGEEAWVKAFRKVEEEGEVQEDPQGSRKTPERQDRAKAEVGRRAGQEHRSDRARAAAERTEQRLREYEDAKAERDIRNAEARDAANTEAAAERSKPLDGDLGETSEFHLSDEEIVEVVERYAEQKAEEAAERAVNHDIQATSRNTHNVAMNTLPDAKIAGYRRVVHPELNESGQSCGLCIVASTMHYTKRDLLPIHSMCKCETVEIYKQNGKLYDPGDQINMEDLDVFYREADKAGIGTTHGWNLKKQRYEVVDHPEYGPTLVNVGKRSSGEKIQFDPRGTQKR
jgi:hypothetical protein